MMVRRAETASFVGGGYVFPGGTVDASDRSPLAREVVRGVASSEMLPWVAAALRETFEEAGLLIAAETTPGLEMRGLRGLALYEALAAGGVSLEGGRLTYLSNWVGPSAAPHRFDTRFFVTEVEADDVSADGVEVTEAVWVPPATALEAAGRGDWPMIFPTVRHLELLSRFREPRQVIAYARSHEVSRVEPRVVTSAKGGFGLTFPDEEQQST